MTGNGTKNLLRATDMRDSVAADSTFYSCCACDIKRKDILFRYLSVYRFYLGDRIAGELPGALVRDSDFSQRITEYNFDYFQLIKPFFGRNPSHAKDGEYEAIGIGYMLDVQDRLRFLIIDDRRPYRFVQKHFTGLAARLTGTIGFVQASCCREKKIPPEHALEFLDTIKRAVKTGGGKRPCGLTPDVCRAILMPAIEYINPGYSAMGENGTHQKPLALDWLIILVISIGTFMTGLDGSIVNIALPAIALSLNISTVTASWVLNAFLIIMISLLITASRYGDMKGYRQVFLGGIVLFTLGSALCGLAPDITFLILSRMLQGVGAAVISALGAAMIISYLPKSVRGQALGIVAMFLMMGVALGPVIGGFLTNAYSWRFIFFVNLPIGVALILLGIHALPRLPPVSPGISLDMPGSVMLFTALSTLIIGLTSVQGRNATTGMAALAASAVFWAVFYAWERRTHSPLVDLSLFANRAYTFQNIGIMLSQMPMAGAMVLMPFYLELVRHIPTDHAWAILLGLPAGMILTAPVSGRISDRIGTKRPIIAGFAICAAALILLSAVSPDTGIWYIVACLFLLGAGTGIVFAPLNSAVMGEAPAAAWGMTSGFVRMMTNIGISLGVALMMLVATAALGPELADATAGSLPPASLSGAFRVTILFFVLPMILGVLLMLPVKDKASSGEKVPEPAPGS